MMHHGMPPNIFYQTTCKGQAWGANQGFVLQEYHGCMWGKRAWKGLEAKTSCGRRNNASKGVDENVWKVQPRGARGHEATKKHECIREEPSQEEEKGKSPIQLLVRVLMFVVQNHLRLSHASRLFRATNHILNPLKVHTPK
jgi:hypothetical protein